MAARIVHAGTVPAGQFTRFAGIGSPIFREIVVIFSAIAPRFAAAPAVVA